MRLNASRIFLVIFVFGVATSWVGSKTLRSFQDNFQQIPQTDVERIHPDVVRSMSMGLWPAWIDYMWIETLLDPMTQKVTFKERSGVYYTVDVLTELDPYYYEAFYGGSHLLTVVRNDHMGARDILLKANRFIHEELKKAPERIQDPIWKTSWTLPLLMGYLYLFELDDIISAKKYLEECAASPGSPAYLQNLVARLGKPEGPYVVGINLLKFIQQTQKDEEQIAKLKRRQTSLEISYHLFQLNQDSVGFKKKNLKKDPWGGEYFMKDGQIDSTTPREKVFGI